MNPPRPSGAHQWSVCHGSHRMQVNAPEQEPSEAAEEGTAAHWLAEQVLDHWSKLAPIAPLKQEYVGSMAENDVLITDEMWDGVDTYVTDVLKSVRGGATLPALQIEQRVDLDMIYPGMSGTPDAYIYDAQANHLTVWDLKFGHGLVEVIKNPQLMIYAAGIVSALGLSEVNITLKIVQPRASHPLGSVRKWQITSKHLNPLIADLSVAAHLAMGEQPNCVSGTHCRYCSARHLCRSLSSTVYNAIDVITESVPMTLDEQGLSTELKLLRRMEQLFKYRLTAIESEIESKLRGGSAIPGFSAKQKHGRKRWKAGTDLNTVAMVGDLTGVQLRKDMQLLTPSQAKKLGIDEAVISLYSETPVTGFNVVEDDTLQAQEAFKK